MRAILKNAALLSIADAAQKGATGILALILARYLEPLIFGQYATAMAVCGLFMMVTLLGFEQEFTRRVGLGKQPTPSALRLTFLAVGVTSVVAFIALVVFLQIGVYPQDVVTLMLLMMVALIVTRFQLPFRYLCLVSQRSLVTTLVQSASTVLLIGLTLAVIVAGGSVFTIVGLQLWVAILTLSAWFLWLRKNHPRQPLPKLRLPEATSFAKGAFPFALSNILWVAYFNFDTFMLSVMTELREVGLYAGAYKIIAITYVLGYAISNSFTPTLFKNSRNDILGYRLAARGMIATLSLAGTLLAGTLLVFSETLVTAILGAEYQGAVVIAQVLSTSVLFRMLNFGLSEILTTSGRQRARIALESCMLGFNIVMNLLLIPRFGGLGAATATVLSELLFMCVAAILWYRYSTPLAPRH